MTNKTSKWALGAVIAGISGYIAGILTAPKSGKDTRQDIKSEASKLGQETEKELNKLHDELNKLIDKIQDKSANIKDSVNSSSNDVLEKAIGAKKIAKDTILNFKEGEDKEFKFKSAIKEVKNAISNLKKHAKNPENK